MDNHGPEQDNKYFPEVVNVGYGSTLNYDKKKKRKCCSLFHNKMDENQSVTPGLGHTGCEAPGRAAPRSATTEQKLFTPDAKFSAPV